MGENNGNSRTQEELSLLEVSGFYAPARNLLATRRPLREMHIDVLKTYIHESIHQFQFLISNLGLMLRANWHWVYLTIAAIFRQHQEVDTPLCQRFPEFLRKLEEAESEIAW